MLCNLQDGDMIIIRKDGDAVDVLFDTRDDLNHITRLAPQEWSNMTTKTLADMIDDFIQDLQKTFQ